MFTQFQAVILGFVEGLTEFLPISSTGHLILASKVLGIQSTDFLKSFEIIIQLGAIFAVLFLYAKKLLIDKNLFLKTAAAFLPTGLIGFVLYKLIKQFLLGNPFITAYSLIIGGIVLVLVERHFKTRQQTGDDLTKLTYRNSFAIGVLQSIAVIPGVSRSGATIVTGLFLGMNRKSIVEFSFMLAIPTMLAASAFDLYKNAGAFSGAEFDLLAIGFITAFISAYFSVKWLLKYVSTHDFTWFGYYRIAAGLAALVLLR